MNQTNNGLDSRAPNTATENQGIEPPMGTRQDTSSNGEEYYAPGIPKTQVTIHAPAIEPQMMKVQVKPSQFVVGDGVESKVQHDHASALIRKRNLRPFATNKTLSKESLFSNSGSQKNLLIEGSTPRTMPLNSPPKTQDRQQSRKIEKIEEILQKSFLAEDRSKRSYAIQNNSFSSEVNSHILHESTELDQIGSIHYREYLQDIQPPQQILTEKKPLFAQRHSSVKQNLTNKKPLLVNEHQQMKHDLTIAEIKQNPHGTISKMLQPYFKNNYTAEGVPDIQQQIKKRILPHSYETFRKQQRSISPSEIKRQAGGVAVRTIVNPPEPVVPDPISEDVRQRLQNTQVGRVVNAKSQVTVPQDLILMKIASRQIELQKQQYLADRKKTLTESQMLSSIGQQRRSSFQPIAKESMQVNQQSSLVEPQTGKNSIKLLNQQSNLSEALTQDWHITDLLKQSTVRGANSLQVNIDYYKRSVKTDKELTADREIIIKNYRLRAVDANKEISENDRKLMLLNKGTTIYVSNSLIKPEIYRFSTKVTNVLAEVFLKEPRDLIFELQDQPVTPSALDNRSQLQSQPLKPSTRPPITANNSVNSRGISSTVSHEPEMAHAVALTQVMIDEWFEAGVSPLSKEHELLQLEQYRQINSDRDRYVLANKEYSALTLKQIQCRMAEPKVVSLLMKPRIIPTEDMTAVTQLQSKPYMNLMRTVVSPEVRRYVSEFKQKTEKFVDPSTLLKTHQDPAVQVVDYYTQLSAVEFMRLEFTHLDQHLIQEINLSQDLFFTQTCVDDLVRQLAEGQKVMAKTEYMFVESGQYMLKMVDVEVTGYNEPFRVFNLENKELGVVTTRSRFNMKIDTDPDSWIQDNRETIDYWRELSQQYLKVHKVINNELLSRYSTLVMEQPIRKNILSKVGSITGYWRKSVEKIVIQVEALYVYSLMKATLASQRNDPFIKHMLMNFKIDLDSEALEIQKQPLKLKGENLHPGILAFRFQAIKNELSKSSLQMSNGKYMQLPKLLYAISHEAIFKHKEAIFMTPIPTLPLQSFSLKFKFMTAKQITDLVNTYPLDHTTWIEAQKVISEQFHTLLQNTWAENIAQQIWGFIKDDFEFDTQRFFTESQIDPNLVQIFHKIKQYQSTILYTVFEAGLRDYINFLLGFALRDQEIKGSSIIRKIAQADQIRLIYEDPNYKTPEGTDVNDLALVRLQSTPFIKLHAEIQVSGKMRNRKFKVITVPDLDQIHKNLMGVVKNLHEATRKLKRVDAIVFPLLELKDPYVQQPDLKTNSKIVFILKLIDKLLEACTYGTRKKLQQFQQHVSIFDKKVDSIVLELKKQSFALANEDSDEEEAIQDQVIAEEAPDHVVRDGSSAESDESDEEDVGFQGNNMAYKSVEIDEGLMRDELESVKKHRFMVMSEVPNSLDFGLLTIDCLPFKEAVIEHCLLVEQELNNYLRNQFAEKMKSVQSEINALKGRLDDNVSSIDDVIALLDYIDGLKKQDNKVEEIADFLEVMTRQADYIDSVQVMLPNDMKFRFYHLLNWPRTFDVWLIKRKQELIETKGQLIQQMQQECEQVVNQGARIKQQLTDLLSYGLTHLNEKGRSRRTQMLETLFEALGPGKQTGPVPVEIPQNTSYKWLANETNWVQAKFDPALVVQVATSLDELKAQFDELEKQTFQINKRQLMLQIERTDFREQRRILEDLKPIHNLWQLAQSFRANIVDWFEEPLDSLDFHIMENQLEEWTNEIKRLQKAPVITKNVKQIELLRFITDSINYVKQYSPLIKTTRVKGLNARHWRSINAELNLVIDPYTITLIRMIGLGLHKADKIKAIKSVSDIAQKEYAIQILTEQLDKEMKLEMFQLQSSRNKDCKVVRSLESVVLQFNEFVLRVSVLKMNPYMRNFFDKLLEIEKTAKQVLEIVLEFENLQNKWVFLSNVLVGSISEGLNSELKIWSNVDKFFKFITKTIHDNPQVVSLVLREGLLQQLRKMNIEIDNVRDGLYRFLEAKRQAFPRLYFLSNEELMQIYGSQGQIINKMVNGDEQPFINVIYQGLIQLKFDEKHYIVGVEAKDGEYLELIKPVSTKTQLEKWLAALELEISNTLKSQILMAYMSMDKDCPSIPEDAKTLRLFKLRDAFRVRKVNSDTLQEWIHEWPGQATYLCQQLWFHQKILCVFQGAVEKAKNVELLKRQIQLQKRGVHHSDDDSDCSDVYKSVHDSSSDNDVVEVKHEAPLSIRSSMLQLPIDGPNEKPESALSEYVVKPKSKMSCADRAMRFFDRFCVNDVQHPAIVLQDIRSGVLQKIKIMISMINTFQQKHTYNSIIALITGCVYQRDQLQEMINQKQFKATDFEWEIQFKFIIDRLPAVFKHVTIPIFESGNYLQRLEVQEAEVRLEVFNFTRYYGYQYLANTERLVITPLTLKAQRSMLVAMNFLYSCAVEGPFGTGKTETVKDLAAQLARQNHTINTSTKLEYNDVLRFLKGIAASGGWVLFDEFNRFDSQMLKYIAQIMSQMQNAIRGQVKLIYIDEQKITIDFETGIFISMNPGYAGRVDLPFSLKSFFRPIQMVVPDLSLIAEILLARAGFSQSFKISKKLTHVQILSNELMQKTQIVKKDFGLRAIRGIVEIAEILRRQSQNLLVSEVPDIINERVLSKVNYKDHALIQEVIEQLIASTEGPSTFITKQNSVKVVTPIESFGTPAMPTVRQSQAQLTTPFEGTMFKQAFESEMTRAERQVETIYQQIGIEGLDPTEEEFEECLIVKAIRDYNNSKYADVDKKYINRIVVDVFSNEIHKLSSQSILDYRSNFRHKIENMASDYTNLKELIKDYVTELRLDQNKHLEAKCYELYELIKVKVGCIVIGETQSAKSTLIQVLQGALNQASVNELKLRVAEVRKERLITNILCCPQIAQLLPPEVVKKLKFQIETAKQSLNGGLGMVDGGDGTFRNAADAAVANNTQEDQGNYSNTFLGKTRRNKLTDKQKATLLMDLYKATKLDRFEIFQLEQELQQKGVAVKRVNPKSINDSELIGEVLFKSGLWIEGLLTKALREFSLDRTTLRKWIHLDGPIDHSWAENLNSLLDENKKISLPHGDTINIYPQTNLIFETDSLKNVTPSTVSRCGIVHLSRENLNDAKQIFNQYLNRLPANIADNAKEIESQVNTLWPVCISVFKQEKDRNNIIMPTIDEYQLIQSFIKILDSFITSYWIDYIIGNKSDWEDAPQQQLLKACLHAQGYPTPKKDIAALVQADTVKLDPTELESTFKAMKVASVTITEEVDDQRLACNDFLASESRLENSLKYLPLWIEAFILTAFSMTFGPILQKPAQQQLSQLIKGKYLQYKTDYTTYQKFKKKLQQQKEELVKRLQRAMIKKQMGTQREMNSSNRSGASSLSPSPRKSDRKIGNNFQITMNNLNQTGTLSTVSSFQEKYSPQFQEPVNDDSKPMFISDFPFDNEFGLNFFDYFYNLDNSTWTKFDNLKQLMRMQQQFINVQSNHVLNLTVNTVDSIKLLYAMECLVVAKKPIMVVGGAASGKSTLIKDMICNQSSLFTHKVLSNHISCNSRINNSSLKERIAINLKLSTSKPLAKKQTKVLVADDSDVPQEEAIKVDVDDLQEVFQRQMEAEAEVVAMKPHGDNVCLLVYVEDVHMTEFDHFKDNSSCETIRDVIAYKQWFVPKKKVAREILNVNVIGCVNPNAAQLPVRFLRQFSVLGIQPMESDTCFTIVNKMLELQSPNWPSSMQNHFPLLSGAVTELCRRTYDYLKPTPIKVQYTFNQREIFKMVSAICQVEGNYMKSLENVSKLFFHEALRQYGDRILMLHDFKWFVRTTKAICLKYFYDKDMDGFDWTKLDEDEDMFASFPVKSPDTLWFSIMNQEVEGQYLESSEPNKIKDLLERQIDRYNQQPDILKLNLVFYQELYRDLFKIMRALNLHASHLIIVGLRGYAISYLVQLAAFITQKAYSDLELRPDFQDEDWKQELRLKIIETGQSNKQVCFVLEEYRMTCPEWYQDIESLMTTNSGSSVLQTKDLPTILSALRLQAGRLAREAKSGIQGNIHVDGLEAMAGGSADDKKLSISLLIKENIKILSRSPNEFNDLYSTLMQRIKKNLHFVLTFTPSGQDFREKMKSHKQLMQNSQLIWVTPLTANDLTQMGEQLFIHKMEEELKLQQAQDPNRDTRLDEHFQKLEKTQNTTILKALVQVYLTTMHFAKLYKENHQHTLYFTPVFFLRSINQYKRLLIERKRNVKETHDRYNQGLNKIKSQLANIAAYQKELEMKTPVLQKRQEKVLAIIVEMQAQLDFYTAKRQQTLEEQKMVQILTKDAKHVRDEAQQQLDCIIPALNSSLAQIQKISKYEIAEIRSMQHPPKLVKTIMKAICILLDVEPQMKTKNGKQKMSYWRASISTLVLADPNLPETLEKFDRKRLTEDKMKLLEELMADPDYTIEGVRKCNAAAEGFFKWIKSLRDFYYIFKELQPRKDALLESERLYQIQLDESSKIKDQLGNLDQSIKHYTGILTDKIVIINELKAEINDLIMRRRRAEVLIRGLEGEKQKWVVCCRVLDDSERAVSGDVVLAAAIINYGGGFAFSYRRQLIETWQTQSLRPLGLNTTPNFQIQELFGDNFKIREWHSNGLGKDILSTDNAIIVQKTKQYITCIDPQHQATFWLKTQYEKQGMIITKVSEPNFQRTLEVAIDLGKLVMVENIPEKLDIHIESLVKQEILKFQDTRMIKFCRKQLKLDPGFGLFLMTSLPKPHLDVNLTNYSTLINFFITQEGLSQSILSLVVANERRDIQAEFDNAMEFTFNSVTGLKDIEKQLLSKLDSETPEQLLKDEECIEILKSSAKTSETIAKYLRKIQQSQESLDKAQQIYTPIAYRAATLFYSIQELNKVNSMYRYGLSWFMAQFNIVLAKANLLSKPSQVTIDDEEFALIDAKLSPEYRVELILNSFTQEISKKVIFSVFQEDRQFVTYYLALRVMHAEQLTDDNLISFAMAGAKEVKPPSSLFKAVNALPWLNNVMWSDVQFLQTLQPFTQQNLAQHILDNQPEWDVVYNSEFIQFDQLPNREMLDLDTYQVVDIRDAIQSEALKIQIKYDEQQYLEETVIKNKTTPPIENKVYTEAEILQDEDIWLVSEGNEEDDRKARDFYQNSDSITEEEQVMARYMTRAGPGQTRQQQDFYSMHTMTKKERSQYNLRQTLLKRTVELAIAKVIRPDLLQACLHQLVSCIYNFQYTSFNYDVLSKFIDFDNTLQIRKQMFQKQISKVEPPKKQSSENNIQLLLQDAFMDSKPNMPIMLLISHSVNVQTELQNFFSTLHLGTKFVQVLCSKGTEVTFNQQVKTSMLNGDWIVVYNLHLEPHWAELILNNLQAVNADTNPKFRLWISIPQTDDCNDQLLKQCIKIALQQPINIKMKIERHLNGLKEGVFRRGQETGTFHKNLFIGLCYLHGVLDGRRAYGPFGWHVAYEFDKNDFDISDQMLQTYLKKDVEDRFNTLEVLKHVFTNINFNGKISRTEDYRKLKAHIDDLFNEQLSFQNSAESDLDHSHFGFPDKDDDILQVMMHTLPQQDHYAIFGFNSNIYRYNQQKVSQQIISNLKRLNDKVLKEQGYNQVHADLENQRKRFEMERQINKPSRLVDLFVSLQKHLQESSLDQTLVGDSDRYDERIDKKLLPLRDKNDKLVAQLVRDIKAEVQQLILALDGVESKSTVVYCLVQEVQAFCNLRDVMTTTLDQFLVQINGEGVTIGETTQLWTDIQNNRLPLSWQHASYDTAITQLSHFLSDLTTRTTYINELITTKFNTKSFFISAFFDPRKFVVAQLMDFSRTQKREVLDLVTCYQVTKCMDYRQVQGDLLGVTLLYGLWIEGADWDIESEMLIEQKDTKIHSRFPVIKMSCQTNKDHGPEFNDAPMLTREERHQLKKEIKVQNSKPQKAIKRSDGTLSGPGSLGPSSEPVSSMSVGEHKKDLKVYVYKCPVFATINRLSLGGVGQENKALFYVDLKSHEPPQKWVKRSVALLLEPSVLE